MSRTPTTTQAADTHSTGSRRVDIDALRVLCVVLVLVVHAAQVYSPWQTWHVQNAERSRLLAQLTLVPAPWLMAMFMLLAGRSAWYSLQTRSERVYLGERVTRLLVPLVAGTLLLVPPMVWVRRTLEGRFDGSYLAFYPHFFEGIYPEGNFSWGHLWFLAYVFMYGVVLLPLLRWTAKRYRDGRGWQRWSGATLCAFVTPLIGLQLLLRAPFPQTNALVNDWSNHAQLLPAFLFGFLLAADATLESAIIAQRWRALALGLTTSAAIALFAWPGNFGDRLPGTWSSSYAFFWAVQAIGTWSWLFAITAWARVLVKREGVIVHYGRAAVYPFYLLHQPVLVFVGLAIVPLSLPVIPEFALLATAGLAITVVLYELIRHWAVSRTLLGIKSMQRTAVSPSTSGTSPQPM